MLTLKKYVAIILLVFRMERWSSWFKAPVLKTGVRESVPWVRIPLSPPKKPVCFQTGFFLFNFNFYCKNLIEYGKNYIISNLRRNI